ncbi:hypothetical protein PF70_03544, partial [Pseudomonas asplenii]
MAAQWRLAALGQQAKAVLQLREQAVQAEVVDLGGGQFDGQWNAVQAAADLDGLGQLLPGQFEAVLAGHGPLDEQLQGGEIQGPGVVLGGCRRRAVERVQTLHELAFGSQALAAGGQDMHLRGAPQQAFAQRRDGVEQVFAVVDHQQHLPFAQAG